MHERPEDAEHGAAVAVHDVPAHELGNEPPLAHDKLYEYEGKLPPEWFLTDYRTFTRPEADAALLEITLRYRKVSRWRAKLAYRMLRMTWTVPDALGITRWQ